MDTNYWEKAHRIEQRQKIVACLNIRLPHCCCLFTCNGTAGGFLGLFALRINRCKQTIFSLRGAA